MIQHGVLLEEYRKALLSKFDLNHSHCGQGRAILTKNRPIFLSITMHDHVDKLYILVKVDHEVTCENGGRRSQ